MAKMFGGFGGFMKSLTGNASPDDPSGKLMGAKKTVKDLEKRRDELFSIIGRMAVDQYGTAPFGDAGAEFSALQDSLAKANQDVQMFEQQIEAARQEEAAAKAARAMATAQQAGTPCPKCGFINVPGARFCQGCGSNLEELYAQMAAQQQAMAAQQMQMPQQGMPNMAAPEIMQAVAAASDAVQEPAQEFAEAVPEAAAEAVPEFANAPAFAEAAPEIVEEAAAEIVEPVGRVCVNCGSPLNPESKFCGVCGTKQPE